MRRAPTPHADYEAWHEGPCRPEDAGEEAGDEHHRRRRLECRIWHKRLREDVGDEEVEVHERRRGRTGANAQDGRTAARGGKAANRPAGQQGDRERRTREPALPRLVAARRRNPRARTVGQHDRWFIRVAPTTA